jgi:hypothetical protein
MLPNTMSPRRPGALDVGDEQQQCRYHCPRSAAMQRVEAGRASNSETAECRRVNRLFFQDFLLGRCNRMTGVQAQLGPIGGFVVLRVLQVCWGLSLQIGGLDKSLRVNIAARSSS